jgi:hypothetical protein
MKKLLFVVLITGLLTGLTYSQNFTFVRTSPPMIYNTIDSDLVSYGTLTNNNSGTHTYICKKYRLNVPTGWTVSYCFSLCYPPFIDSTSEVLGNGPHDFSMHFMDTNLVGPHNPGTGYASMVVYDITNPSVKDSVVFGATGWPLGIKPISSTVSEFKLNQNYPNPFNPTTKIVFSIPKSDFVDLRIYDILGREVAVLASGYVNAGEYEVEWDAKNLASGMYYYRLKTPDNVAVKKMTLVK